MPPEEWRKYREKAGWEPRVVPRKLTDFEPGMSIDGYKAVSVIQLNYGVEWNEVGRNEKIVNGIRHVSNGYMLNTGTRAIFDRSGRLYLVDLINKNVKNIDLKSGKIESVMDIKDFSKLHVTYDKKDYRVYKFDIFWTLDERSLIISSEKTYFNNGVVRYYNLNLKTGEMEKKKADKFYFGGRHILSPDDPCFSKVDSFYRKLKKLRPDLLDYSFAPSEKGDLIFTFLTKKTILIYRYLINEDTFSFVAEKQYQKDKEQYTDYALYKIECFLNENCLMIFLNKGNILKPIKRGLRTFNVAKYVTYNTKTGKFSKFLNSSSSLGYYTVYKGGIYTWDSLFTTKKFNVYMMESDDLRDKLMNN